MLRFLDKLGFGSRRSPSGGAANPTYLQRIPPLIPAQDDLDLAQEGAVAVSTDELEKYLQDVRRSRQQLRHRNEKTSWLVAIQRAEKFMNDCFEIGPPRTHQTKAAHLALALEAWSDIYARGTSDAVIVTKAFITILEWNGGYTATINGTDTFVGVLLNRRITDRINEIQRIQDRVPEQINITRCICEMME